MDWPRLLAYITGTVDQELLLRNEYLAAENRILKAQIKGRLLLSDAERITLAERWVKSVKEECLAKLILIGEASLKRALEQYVVHYHAERNHQAKGNVLLFPSKDKPVGNKQGAVQCQERLGGLLKYYYREAA